MKSEFARFDVAAFVHKHRGYKETSSARSCEYLLQCAWCGSDRLRWNHPEKQTWICWGCNRSGTSPSLVAALEKVSFEDAVRYMHAHEVPGGASHTLVPIAKRAQHRPVDSLRDIMWPRGVDLLAPVVEHRKAWEYLTKRGVLAHDAIGWKLGFGRTGRLQDFIVFPIFIGGRLVYWQARATFDPPAGLTHEGRKQWIKENGYRKTLNPTEDEAFTGAGDVVLNYDRARTEPHVVVCEGPFDAIKIGPHAIALLGKVATPAKLALLKSCKAQRYTVYLDRGEKEWASAVQIAAELSAFAPTYLAVPPEGQDPGSLSPLQNAAVISAAVPSTPVAQLGTTLYAKKS